jgi:homoserine trans-succinylase
MRRLFIGNKATGYDRYSFRINHSKFTDFIKNKVAHQPTIEILKKEPGQ